MQSKPPIAFGMGGGSDNCLIFKILHIILVFRQERMLTKFH